MSIKRQNFSTVSCSKRKIEAKLKKIYRNIKGTSKEIAGVEMLLKQLAQYDIGQRTIIRMPENVKI